MMCTLTHLHTRVLVKSCFTKDLDLPYVPERCRCGVQQAELARMPACSPNPLGQGWERGGNPV